MKIRTGKYLVFLTLTIIILLGAGTVTATEHFATNSSEIVRGLTETRPRALTRSFAVPQTRTVVVVEYDPVAKATQEMPVTETIGGPNVNLKIEFDLNSATIRTNSFRILSELLKALDDPQLTDKQIMLCGHTDALGPNAYNLDLSYKRALAVKSYLRANRNIKQNQFKVRGYGETLPIADNRIKSGRQKNRRVEIRIVE